jgi:transcription antitermination factor NusG
VAAACPFSGRSVAGEHVHVLKSDMNAMIDELGGTVGVRPCAENWFAVQVETRKEPAIAAQLRSKGYEEFLPQYQVERAWTDRIKRVTLAAFPGYLFCRFNPAGRTLPILTTPGVIRLVGTGKVPIPIEDAEIESIRKAAAAGFRLEPYFPVAKGHRVVLTEGPLAGCEGIVEQIKKSWRLVISITLLQRSVAVEIDRSWTRVI